MTAFLHPDVILTSDRGVPRLMHQVSRTSHSLKVAEALAVTFLSAEGDPHAAEASCSKCLPDQNGAQWVKKVLDRFWTYFGDYPPRPVSLEWLETIDVNRLRVHQSIRREAAPSAIIWLVTLACNRRCPYCFYRVTPHSIDRTDSPADATFPLDKVVRMIMEMAKIGAADFYLTGGEPLLRHDLPEIIQAATIQRVRTHLVTKYPVPHTLAETLARVGLTDVTFSLDDARTKEAGMLAGAPGYLEEAISALEALMNAGLSVEVNAVVTQRNAEHLESLVKLLITLDIPKLTLNSYSLPVAPRPSALQLVVPELNLAKQVTILQAQYGHHIELKLGSGSAAGVGLEPCGQKAVCDVGFRDFHVLPDGSVTRCRYLPNHTELIVGSLREQTIMDIWNGESLTAFTNPSADLYEDTACSGCDSFQACNNRGRCYLTALTRSNQLMAPDEYCVRQ